MSVAVEARNLAPLPADIDHTLAAALPISGLTGWQGLFDHGRLTAGETVRNHGAAGAVGSIAVQLSRAAGARVIGTGSAADRDLAFTSGVHTFVDPDIEKLQDASEVDVVFDVIGGDILTRSTAMVCTGGTLVTIVEFPKTLPREGRAVFLAHGYGMDASSRRSERCCRWRKPLPPSLPINAFPASPS